MWRAENTLICTLALTVPNLMVFLPFQAFFTYGLWILLVQLAAVLILIQPINFCELALGQRSQKGPLKCWCFGPAWKGIGLLMLTITGWEVVSTNMDILEFFRQKQAPFLKDNEHLLGYGQLIGWLSISLIAFSWPKATGKLWILISLICFGGITALAARALTLNKLMDSINRLWRLSARLPEDVLELLRISLLPMLSATGSGVLITLGSYRPQTVNAFVDSWLMIIFVLLFHILQTASNSALLAYYCQKPPTNATIQCQLDNLRCPISLASGNMTTCRPLLLHYNVKGPDSSIENIQLYRRLLDNLPVNDLSPTLWIWTWNTVCIIIYSTYVLVRVDTWIRAFTDKLQGWRTFRKRTITTRVITSFFVSGLFGSAGYYADKYRNFFNVQVVYQVSTVRWLPILLGALTCLAVVHGYGGIKFIKEIGGGIALRPWFLVLTGFITPALLISLGGLRMHQSITTLLKVNAEETKKILPNDRSIGNLASLLLAVSAFLFLLAGLFSPLIWHGMCRRQRCAQLVQPTKSWSVPSFSNNQRSRSDSGGSNEIVRDLGLSTVSEQQLQSTPMLQQTLPNSIRLQHINSNPMLTDSIDYRSASPPPPPPPPEMELGTVRFHPGNGTVTTVAGYSTATLPARTSRRQQYMNDNSKTTELRFAMDNAIDQGNHIMGASKTLNRGILKNKHEAGNYRTMDDQRQQLVREDGALKYRNHSSEVL